MIPGNDLNSNFYAHWHSTSSEDSLSSLLKENFKKIEDSTYFAEKTLGFSIFIPYLNIPEVISTNSSPKNLFFEINFDYLFKYYKENNKLNITFSHENQPSLHVYTFYNTLELSEKLDNLKNFNIYEHSIIDVIDYVKDNLIPSAFDEICKNPKSFFANELPLNKNPAFPVMIHYLSKKFTSAFNNLDKCIKSSDLSPLSLYEQSFLLPKLINTLSYINTHQLHHNLSSTLHSLPTKLDKSFNKKVKL